VAAVSGDLEAPFSPGTNAVQFHELLYPSLAHRDTARHQLSPDARPAVAATALGVDGFDMHQQRLVAQMTPLHAAGPTHEVLVVSGHADTEHLALYREQARRAGGAG